MSKAEIIVDSIDREGDDIMYILPNHLNSSKFLASGTFDKATIQNCSTENITSAGLLGIYNSLKPGAYITIYIDQPIAIMLPYDAKQVEANLRLVGFDDIVSKDINIKNEKTGMMVPTVSVVAQKKIKEKEDDEKPRARIEVKTTNYKETKNPTYKGKRDIRGQTSTTVEVEKTTVSYGKNNTFSRRKKY